MTLLEAGDRLVKKIGLYRLTTIGTQEPRGLRWWPLLILAAVTIGYALLMWVGYPHDVDLQTRFGAMIAAAMLFFGGFAMANYIRFLGPRLGSRLGSEQLDERELAIRARAFAWSGSAIAWFAVLGCLWFGLAPLVGGWMPSNPTDWIYLAMVLEAWVLTLPVLIASWLQPRPADEG